jgi:alpha-glucosidase
MARSVALLASVCLAQALGALSGPVSSTSTGTAASTQFTVPAAADVGAQLIANIDDPSAVNAQTVCPGYTASDVHNTRYGFAATLKLAGQACNAYGTDVESLNITVEYQSEDRLNIQIVPTHVDASNASWYILPENLVPKPGVEPGSQAVESDLLVSWSNEPSFNLKVIRNATGDILFNTEGSVLVFENQFVEFVSSLPEDYNLYGLGERIHGLRLGNNFTATTYASDIGDPIDQ